MELARFALDSGGSVVVEVDEGPGVARASRQDRVVREARVTFERALAEVRRAASSALGQFQALDHRPDEVEIRFGVHLDAEAGAVIAKAGASGHFEVGLTWRPQPDPARDQG